MLSFRVHDRDSLLVEIGGTAPVDTPPDVRHHRVPRRRLPPRRRPPGKDTLLKLWKQRRRRASAPTPRAHSHAAEREAAEGTSMTDTGRCASVCDRTGTGSSCSPAGSIGCSSSRSTAFSTKGRRSSNSCASHVRDRLHASLHHYLQHDLRRHVHYLLECAFQQNDQRSAAQRRGVPDRSGAVADRPRRRTAFKDHPTGAGVASPDRAAADAAGRSVP